ncbi:cupin domain-containing protein [Alteriqipengyuania lutimaris]|uniref:Cupin domain-containing protein n=2 Tax=Alteriqipengyuania lutimaris TaxID=1538146 RepID=A0A395LGC5_9SPHN|nr:mannose-6-phosphate isomerase-like protein (cupin superfamily) [Alteriqipengyuania lutimaris]RDS75671.1 cupin domain-containing protein [Alteriqipengyuania lutimaris]
MRGAAGLTVGLLLAGCAGADRPQTISAPQMVVVSETDVMVREAPPHGAIGMSTAYRISDAAPQPRKMEFRRRVLDPGAAVGEHPIAHDEVYYVTAGRGVVISDGVEAELTPGMAAYLYEGAIVGIRQTGSEPLSIIIAYPVSGED